MSTSRYDLCPHVRVPGADDALSVGWDGIAATLRTALSDRGATRAVLAVETYPGVDDRRVAVQLAASLKPALAVLASGAFADPDRIDALVEPFLGAGDPVFGFLCSLELPQFFDKARLERMRRSIESVKEGVVLIVGCGATHIVAGDVLVYADLARWEAQRRFRRGETGNLGALNKGAPAAHKYKRAFFVDWRVADRWKKPLLEKAAFFLDTHERSEPKVASGVAVRSGLEIAASRPFRVVPFFDPAPWGGQWMREKFGLPSGPSNFGWCFDCVPEENSLRLRFGKFDFELPSLDLVLTRPLELLGKTVFDRFGAEFPIRFDLLDTMGGGNLSLQVHPLNAYVREKFGMPYTQDESYYILDAGSGSSVYLGVREGTDPAAMLRDLREAQRGALSPFPAERYANRVTARPHDHFLIPAGTLHCSGAQTVVLEISATPYLFTFKLWDWGRMGLDGRPRPIHLEHGIANLQWDRTGVWAASEAVNAVRPIASGEGWREERTGLHDLEFIETRRHWFTGRVPHDTAGNLNVLNLVQGAEALVESPSGAFEPFEVHYAETFIVPASVGAYTIRPHGKGAQDECATIKAFVREAGPSPRP